jgi:Uma2 family endonuclease
MSGRDDVRPAPGVKLTYDDYVLFPDDGMRHELIDGEHFVTPTPNLKHQAIVRNLIVAIADYLRQHRIGGKVYGAPLAVILSTFDVVEPDVLFISRTREPEVLTGDWVHGAPDLVVEIASPSTRKRDATVKKHLYERWAVFEYWIVDPDAEIVTVFRRADATYAVAATLSRERADVLITPLLPGFELPLTAIFED